MENYLKDFEERLLKLAFAVPNDTHPDTPLGPESAAVTLSTHGPEPLPPSSSRDHVSIGRTLGLLDLEAAATVTGSSWYYLLNEGALLEMALVNYALSIAIRHGFTPVTTPDVVRADVAHRCGFQPRDPTIDPPVSQMYHISPSNPELVLAGTAEIPLAGLFANRLFNEGELPAKVVGLGRAFRAEAGARGADTRGLYRVHQFTKLELFAVSESEQSEEIMEEMKKLQIEIFEGLGLSFRYVMACIDALSTKFKSIPVTGSWICRQRSWVRPHTENMTWKPGCPVAEDGVKYLQPQIVRIIKLEGYISAIAPAHCHQLPTLYPRHPLQNLHSRTH